MTRTAIKEVKQKTCKACGSKFTPSFNSTQVVCSIKCAQAHAPANHEKARKAIAQREREQSRADKERVKPKGAHAREAQALVNEWVRLRDADQPCISCGRHHEGQYHAGHFRTVGSAPELRFEPLNIHKQCAPCNNHLSGNILNFRPRLIEKIGAEAVAWLEGPHPPKRYAIADFQAIKAEYRQKIKALKEQRA